MSADPGSGFIVGRRGSRYTVVTADHVMRGKGQTTPKCVVLKMHDGEVYRVPQESVRLLERNDLAVFEFDSPRDYPVAQLSNYQYPLYADRNYQKSNTDSKTDSGELVSNKQVNRKEFYVFAAGYPNLRPPSDDLTCGSDSSTSILQDPKIWSPDDRLVFNPGLLTDTSGTSISNPEVRINNYELVYSNITAVGMSGGPVVDPNGRVVGMHGRSDGKQLNQLGQVVADYLTEVGAEDTRLSFGMSAGVPISAILRLAPSLKLDQSSLTVSSTAPNTPIVDSKSWLKTNQFASAQQSDNVLYWLQQGNQQWRLGQVDDAQNSFDKALETDRKKKNGLQHFGYFLKGFVYAKSEKYTQALENCGKATDIPEGREFYEAWRCKASSLAYLGQFPSATVAMNKALEIQDKKIKESPNTANHNPSDYAVLAELLWQQGQFNGALIHVGTAVLLRREQDLGESASLYNLQATILTSLDQYDAAIEKCDRALSVNPNYATALTTKGLVFQKQGKKDQAEASYRKATQINPQDSNAWNNLGFALYELERSQEALAAFDRAVQLNPDDVAARQNRDDLRKVLKP